MPLLFVLALLAGLPQASRLHAQADPPAIARLVVHPAEPTMTSGDTLRLTAQAFDAADRPVPGVEYHFAPDGDSPRADVRADGLVSSGRAGSVSVLVTARAPGVEPVTERVEVRMTPGPAAYIEITPPVERLVVGQRWNLTATAYSRLREIQRDPISWTSSAPEIVRVDGGQLTALRPGSATIRATGSGTSAALPVEVVGTEIAEIELTPARVQATPGQVIRFGATPRDSGGSPVGGLTPVYSVAPSGAVISADGIFVGYEPGEYRVTASVGDRSAEAVVQLGPAPQR